MHNNIIYVFQYKPQSQSKLCQSITIVSNLITHENQIRQRFGTKAELPGNKATL